MLLGFPHPYIISFFPRYLLIQPEIPRKHHGGRGRKSLPHVVLGSSWSHWAMSLYRIRLGTSFPSTSPGSPLVWMHWPRPVADAHNAHHASWPSTAHLVSSCPDIRSPWFPFLGLGISASPMPHILICCREPKLGGALSQALYKLNRHNIISNLLVSLHVIVG